MNPRVEKIKQLYSELNKLRLDDYAYYPFQRQVDQILDEINALMGEEPDEKKKIPLRIAYSGLSHTAGKEVGYIKYHQDLMHKKNAAKVRRTEYYNSISKAVDQVYMDIFNIMTD